MFSTLSDRYLLAACWAGMVSVVLTLVLALLIAGIRVHLVREARRWDAFVAHWRPLLLGAMLSEDAGPRSDPPPLARRDRRRFLRLWTYMHESVRGEVGDRLNDLARRLGMNAVARQLLRSGSRAEQLQAVLALGYLQDEPAWEPLRALATAPDALISVNAARALTQIDAQRAARELMPLLLARTDWDLSRVAACLGASHEALPAFLARHWRELPAPTLTRALRLAAATRQPLSDEALAYLLEGQTPPPVLAAALPLVTTASLRPHVRRLIPHRAAEVREQAARCLGRLAQPLDTIALLPLLQDASWPVRVAAAEALVQLPFLTPQQCRELVAPDTPAHALLAHALAEKEMQ